MKAAVFYGKHDLRVTEIDVLPPADNQVRIQVKFCGVCGTDIHIYEGEPGAAPVVPPTVIGHEFSGVVSAVGRQVTRFRPGDRVAADPNDMCGECYYCRNGMANFCENGIGIGTTCDGGFAEFVTVREKQVYPIPDHLSFEAASQAETLSCCLNGIDLCQIRAGQSVLIIGAGPIGLLMLQLARMSGAGKIIVSEIVPEKRALALKYGANIVVDPAGEDLYAVLAANTPNVVCVIECAGTIPTIAQAIRSAGKGATVMMFGLTAPDAETPIQPYDIFKRQLKLTSSFINPYTFERAVEILALGKVKVDEIITDIVPLPEINKVFNDSAYRRRGKVLIRI
ncbi:MAG TPA: alcohol dehydrogenase [Clostridiales bacterium]|nr:alcohol dehydrogenase [Clostridiales bacterium]